MGFEDLKRNVKSLKRALDDVKKAKLDLKQRQGSSTVFDYKKTKEESLKRLVLTCIEGIKSHNNALVDVLKGGQLSKALRLADSLTAFYYNNEVRKLDLAVEELAQLISELEPEAQQGLVQRPKKIPIEIKAEVNADLDELEKCFASACFRSCVILCGRILEVVLHRKYFEATGHDLLEKSPGIGLGKMVAKLREKEVIVDPGLPQQIHFINQVRISSVHQSQEAFYPSRAQAQATILYTMDIVEKFYG